MNIQRIAELLDSRAIGAQWLHGLGIENGLLAHASLVRLEAAGVPRDLLAALATQLETHLPDLSDGNMALANLERFVVASRNPLSSVALIERDPTVLPALLLIFSASQHLSDLLVQDGEAFDLLRLTEGKSIDRQVLIDEVCAEIRTADDENDARQILLRYKRREMLRIAYGDIVQRHEINTVTEQISSLADALCEAAIQWSRNDLVAHRGEPIRRTGGPARFVAVALGQLGGTELNYSSDVSLVFLCDGDGHTHGDKNEPNIDFFGRLAKRVVDLLGETSDLAVVYRVARPVNGDGPLVMDAREALRRYDVAGRTWERQAFVKARPVAGDAELGDWFLSEISSWVYRKYLTSADITGIKALKRRIEKRAKRLVPNVDTEVGTKGATISGHILSEFGFDEIGVSVKTCRGGLRNIEHVIQFLQLLNGGDLPQLRIGNTLEAIRRLESVDCLRSPERTALESNYSFLRNIEHRMQIMFDLQTHFLPQDSTELKRLAVRLGYEKIDALETFQRDFVEKTEQNQEILDHLLHDAFPDDEATSLEADLVLDPEPDESNIAACLGQYPFRDLPAAYRNLASLSREKVAFLSGRRCRHYLAAIAHDLIKEIAATPDPDLTLSNLSNVSESLGAKGVLWELFSFNAPTLHLYVRLCASSPYLSGILTSYPGMIDELLDSLLMDSLPSYDFLQVLLADLLRGAADPVEILQSFKSAQHLRVGVRDLIGKDDIRDTHRALSDIAEVCLNQVTSTAYENVVERFGRPMSGETGCEFVILALGKLGGQEPNYHSDLDIVFLYEDSGMTVPIRRGRESTTNQHFFAQLAQRITKEMTTFGPHGRLFDLDTRLRPTGPSGSMALSFDEFAAYFQSGQAKVWERQALCKARVVVGSAGVSDRVAHLIRQAIITPPWTDAMASEIYDLRMKLENDSTPTNLKRSRGGTMDIEFLVQMLQLKHAATSPEILLPGTLASLEAMDAAGILDTKEASDMAENYRFLRSVEARLRLMNTTKRHDLPTVDQQRNILAFLIGIDRPELLEERCRVVAEQNRQRFERHFRR